MISMFLWAPGLVKKIQSEPIGQKGVEYTTELPADLWAQGLLKKLTVSRSVRSK